jgi:hypothetical protein
MYDFYPEWGPSRHRDEQDSQPPTRRARYWREPALAGVGAGVGAGAPEARDADRDRPDDN